MFIWRLSFYLSEGEYYRNGHKSLGVLAATWSLAAFVFINAYNCVLVSYLSVQYNTPEMNTLADLAQSADYKVTTMKGTIYEMDFLVFR